MTLVAPRPQRRISCFTTRRSSPLIRSTVPVRACKAVFIGWINKKIKCHSKKEWLYHKQECWKSNKKGFLFLRQFSHFERWLSTLLVQFPFQVQSESPSWVWDLQELVFFHWWFAYLVKSGKIPKHTRTRVLIELLYKLKQLELSRSKQYRQKKEKDYRYCKEIVDWNSYYKDYGLISFSWPNTMIRSMVVPIGQHVIREISFFDWSRDRRIFTSPGFTILLSVTR